jgi:3-hydroxyacyl-[acyl-carrier-protein] dehydratase
MRFLYYDRVVNIEKGKTIHGIKTFSLSEEFLRGHFRKTALIPGVLFVEAMAQLLGWLIVYSHDFRVTALLSLIEDVHMPSQLRPGVEADIHAEIISTSSKDSLGRAQMYIKGQKIASMDRIIFSHVHNVQSEKLAALFSYYSGLKLN